MSQDIGGSVVDGIDRALIKRLDLDHSFNFSNREILVDQNIGRIVQRLDGRIRIFGHSLSRNRCATIGNIVFGLRIKRGDRVQCCGICHCEIGYRGVGQRDKSGIFDHITNIISRMGDDVAGGILDV